MVKKLKNKLAQKAKDDHKSVILWIVAIAQFMVVLDTTVVNVALPSIQKALNFSPENLQWVVTGYTLAVGGFLLFGGRISDLYGRKKTFLTGVALFGIASFLTGLAHTEEQLIVGRIVQGLTAAFMSPAALSIIIHTFKEGHERNKALGVWGGVAAGGGAAGLLIGGVLTEYLGWEWNFFINVPVAILVVYLGRQYIIEGSADLKHRHMDLSGALFVTAGLMTLVYGLTKAPEHGWTNEVTLTYFAISVALLAAFFINEKRVKHPLMPLSIFKSGSVLGANVTQLPITAGMFSMFFFLTLYVQNILQFSPVKSGFAFFPITIFIGITSAIISNKLSKIGYKKVLMVAPLIMGLGLYMLSHIPPEDGSYFKHVFPGLAVMAVGMGMSFVSLTVAATSGVSKQLSGLASGLLNTSQQIGGSLGLAILSGVSAAKTKEYMTQHAHEAATNPYLTTDALVHGFQWAFYVGVGFAILAALSATFLLKQPKVTTK